MIDERTGMRMSWRAIVAVVAVSAAALTVPVATASGQSTGHIITQPARDVGLEKTKIPPLLVKVSENPYTTEGTGSCAQISSSIAALSRIIGPDFSSSPAANKRNMAKIGGAAVVDSLIPFRGIVRAVSGASAAEQRKNAAIDAGVARRGFLRGLQIARKCR